MIAREKLVDALTILLERAVTELPADVKQALQDAYSKESDELAEFQLGAILANIRTAEELHVPMCQDTGVPIFFVEQGALFPRDIDLLGAIRDAVARATERIPLRPNVVHPITRQNLGHNVEHGMPYVHYQVVPGRDYLDITVVPKGGGSENMSSLGMLPADDPTKRVKEFVIEKISEFMGKPCPPYVVGVGIGGSSDIAMTLAKLATLRPIGSKNSDSEVARLEMELLAMINSTGIGTMGLGGSVTALAVHVEAAGVHTASLPVAINMQCWAARRATMRLRGDGTIEYLATLGNGANERRTGD